MLKTKAKTAAGKRALKKKEPTVVEGAKTAVFLKSTTTSQVVTDSLKELCTLKKPDAVMFSKRNDIHPFVDPKQFEFLSQKNDASLFVLGNHSKKRPNNFVVARMFDYQLLDMIELGIVGAVPLEEFKAASIAIGNRPFVVFNGEVWEASDELRTAKSILMDMYTGDRSAEYFDLRGVSHTISFTAVFPSGYGSVEGDAGAPRILMRIYAIKLMKSGEKLPRIELEQTGPSFDFVLRRVRVADPDVKKQAMKMPKDNKPKKEKNVERNDFGEKVGRVWIDKQDLSKLQTRKMKGLKRSRDENESENESETE